MERAKRFTVTTLASLPRDLATLQRNLLNLLFLVAATEKINKISVGFHAQEDLNECLGLQI